MLGKVECFASIGVLPIAPKCLPDDWVVWFLETLWFLVEARQIPLDHSFHPHERFTLGGGLEKVVIIRWPNLRNLPWI